MNKLLKIATVVVTYNRLELLKECIESLRNQTRKIDEIFVINNSSTDGTDDWLCEQIDLTTITQPNSGGAGGFYSGMRVAYNSNYDWMWVMDDDGLPTLNALEELMKHTDTSCGVLNSLVVSKTNKSQLVFGIEDYLKKEYYKTVAEVSNKEFVNGVNFFNGSFISKETIKKIGFPEPLFFIYGDDLEYYLRIRSKNIKLKTIIKSVIFHPPQEHRFVGKGKYYYRINNFNLLGAKYFPRNTLTICLIYKEFTCRRLIKHYIYDLIGILFLQKKISFAFYYIISIFKGFPFALKIKNKF